MRGSTLIEVVVAGFLLSLFLLFSIQPLVTSNQATELNLRRQQREALAAQLLERALLCSYQALRPESGVGCPSERSPGQEEGTLSWQVEVDESDDLLRVQVTVTDTATDESTVFQSLRMPRGERSHEE